MVRKNGVRPIIIQGHERPLTMVKFNREGDLLFTAAKDHRPCLWYAENGERIGTYDGHNGTVWCIDCNCESTSCSPRPVPHVPKHRPQLAALTSERLRCLCAVLQGIARTC